MRGRLMNSPRSKMGYGGHRWHISTVGLYGVRAGGSPPSQVPEVALAKTSDLYVPYVPPVTDPGVLGMSPQHVRIIDLMLGDHGFIPSRTTPHGPPNPVGAAVSFTCSPSDLPSHGARSLMCHRATISKPTSIIMPEFRLWFFGLTSKSYWRLPNDHA